MDASIEIIDGDRGAKYPKQDDLTATGDCLFLSAANVTRNGFNFARCQYISFEKDKSLGKGKLKRSDVILTTRGTVGNVAYFNDAVPFEHMRINSGMLILRADRQQIDPTFLYMVMRSDLTGDQIMALLTGSAQPQLPIRELRFFQIPLPPLAEQRAIAAILSTWDEAITLTGRLIDALKRRKQALMQLLLTGKVRFPGFDGEWEEVELSQLATVIMGQSPSSDFYNSDGDGLPLIQGNADIANRRSAPRFYTTQLTKLCEVGDILLSVRAPVGETAWSVHQACIGRGIAAIRPTNADKRFLYQILLSLEQAWITYAQGSTFPAINSDDIRSRVLRAPSKIEEQEYIGSVLAECDREAETLETVKAHLQAQKRGLMQQLLTGQVRVNVDEGES